MKVMIVAPVPHNSTSGNGVTARRWATILQSLGHEVLQGQAYDGERVDVLVALHAARSHAAVAAWRKQNAGPLVVAMTGTDLYRDLPASEEAQESLKMADRVVVLQPLAVRRLPELARPKARVILQSAEPFHGDVAKNEAAFQVCVLAHLRPEKDPLRVAAAARMLPQSSRMTAALVGKALDDRLEKRVQEEVQQNPRLTWLGGLPAERARGVLAGSHVLVVSSVMEGGANVIAEALCSDVPVVATEIDGNVGMLGKSYEGYFPVGDTQALAEILAALEHDQQRYQSLQSQCRRLAPLFAPRREVLAWESLMEELSALNRAGRTSP